MEDHIASPVQQPATLSAGLSRCASAVRQPAATAAAARRAKHITSMKNFQTVGKLSVL